METFARHCTVRQRTPEKTAPKSDKQDFFLRIDQSTPRLVIAAIFYLLSPATFPADAFPLPTHNTSDMKPEISGHMDLQTEL